MEEEKKKKKQQQWNGLNLRFLSFVISLFLKADFYLNALCSLLLFSFVFDTRISLKILITNFCPTVEAWIVYVHNIERVKTDLMFPTLVSVFHFYFELGFYENFEFFY